MKPNSVPSNYGREPSARQRAADARVANKIAVSVLGAKRKRVRLPRNAVQREAVIEENINRLISDHFDDQTQEAMRAWLAKRTNAYDTLLSLGIMEAKPTPAALRLKQIRK